MENNKISLGWVYGIGTGCTFVGVMNSLTSAQLGGNAIVFVLTIMVLLFIGFGFLVVTLEHMLNDLINSYEDEKTKKNKIHIEQLKTKINTTHTYILDLNKKIQFIEKTKRKTEIQKLTLNMLYNKRRNAENYIKHLNSEMDKIETNIQSL